MKLFAFYLLDAISKNVYELYAHRFSSFVVPLYLESYSQVDENTRGKMEEMLLTWRTGSPTRKELFGVPQQIAIERGVWGDGGTSNSVSPLFFVSPSSSSFPQSGFHSGSGQITKSQVLSELQFTLGQKERAVLSNPYDTTSQNHIAVLHQVRLIFLESCKSPYLHMSQLRKLVEAGVSQNELRQILTQLRNIVKNSTPASVPQPTLPSVHNWSSQPPFPPHFQGVSLSQAYPQVDSAASTAANVNSSTPMPPPANVANILSSLLKAGVLSTSQISATVESSANENETSTESKETKDEVFDEYRSAILSVNVGLNTLDLAK
jgi:pre-mRNA cleavage complex 2 protein Pcf11